MADWNCNLCKEYKSGIACTYCDDGSEFVKMSNADRIRAMSDEELAEFLPIVSNMMCQVTSECIKYVCNHGECTKTTECALKWLQSEA